MSQQPLGQNPSSDDSNKNSMPKFFGPSKEVDLGAMRHSIELKLAQSITEPFVDHFCNQESCDTHLEAALIVIQGINQNYLSMLNSPQAEDGLETWHTNLNDISRQNFRHELNAQISRMTRATRDFWNDSESVWQLSYKTAEEVALWRSAPLIWNAQIEKLSNSLNPALHPRLYALIEYVESAQFRIKQLAPINNKFIDAITSIATLDGVGGATSTWGLRQAVKNAEVSPAQYRAMFIDMPRLVAGVETQFSELKDIQHRPDLILSSELSAERFNKLHFYLFFQQNHYAQQIEKNLENIFGQDV